MHLPAVDVAVLRNVIHGLHAQRMHTYVPGHEQRGVVALILRFANTEHQRTLRLAHEQATRWHARQGRQSSYPHCCPSEYVQHTGAADAGLLSSLIEHMDRCIDDDTGSDCSPHATCSSSSLSLLLVKHTNVPAGSWSGQLGFPGGLRDSATDVDDVQALYRTVYASIGMPLQHSHEFICLGRMRDYMLRTRPCMSGWGWQSGSVRVPQQQRAPVRARFVFLHLGSLTPSLTLARHAIDGVFWVPLTHLRRERVCMGVVAHPLQCVWAADHRLVRHRHAQFHVSQWVDHRTMLLFPSVCVRLSSSNENVGCSESTNTCFSTSWHVWGFALRCASELTQLARGTAALDWPLVACNSVLLQYTCIHALHGYYELGRLYYTIQGTILHRAACALGHRSRCYTLFPCSADDKRELATHAAYIPYSASLLVHSAPRKPSAAHVVSWTACVTVVLVLLWLVTWVMYSMAAAVRRVCGAEAKRAAWARRRAYYTECAPYSVERERHERAKELEREQHEPNRTPDRAEVSMDTSKSSAYESACLNEFLLSSKQSQPCHEEHEVRKQENGMDACGRGCTDVGKEKEQRAPRADALQRQAIHWASEHVQAGEAKSVMQRYLSRS